MDYNAILSKAAEYTEKFVNAAVPVAQKAYEIGLLTLRIDAAGQILCALAACVISFVLIRLLFAHKGRCQAAAEKHNENRALYSKTWDDFSGFDDMGLGLCVFLSGIPALASLYVWLDIWIWVKLFAPDLWLAKQAIDAVLNAVAK